MKNPEPTPRPVDRRSFLQKAAAMAAGVALLPVPARTAQPPASGREKVPPAPRLYYHHDGSWILMCVPSPITLEHFVYEIVGRLLGTQVDGIICHMFTVGDTVPLFKSGIEEAALVAPKMLKSVNNWRNVRNLTALLKMEADPWKEAIALTHANGKEFWSAMRFNDGHPDSYGLRNSFRLKHPEYNLKDGIHQDFSFPEVRAFRLRQVEEICTLYDVDGFELDFTRDIGVHFPPEKKEAGVGILNAYLKEFRQMLDRVGQKRGRPLKFGVRVTGTPEICRQVGYDVATWIREELIDVLTPSVYYDTTCELPFDSFVDMARGSSCLVYASVTEGVGPGRFAPPPLEAVRAAALNAWRQGIQGINLFNFHHQTITNRVEAMTLLSEIGSPHTLEYTRKLYMIAGQAEFYQGQNKSITEYAPQKDYLGSHPRQVPVVIEPGGPVIAIRIPVGDNIAEARAKHLLSGLLLRLDLCNVTGDEEMEFTWNGKKIPLAMAKMDVSLQYPWNWNGMHSQLEAKFDLTHGDWVKGGDNTLKIRLKNRPNNITLPFMLWAVRLEVDYNVLPLRIGREIET
ncbi:MAG: twin-arginine translocation signal domain-containing protein [Lacunisphaera sp.]|nr:twin-arginine translocation signal domain-containing protein [Lacunisphaera sp.]